MADQTQTESLDQGATKDSNAEGKGGVNGMTNKTINEESRTDVNPLRSMADQMQTESLDQGETKDSSSIIAPGATANSENKTSGLAFHYNGTDKESRADRDEGVNGMTNRTINEESGNEVNDKIADDENGIIHETIRKGGSNKVDENKKDNETVSLNANETVGKGDATFVKRSSETVYRGNGRKYSESNDEVTQKSNNGANDRGNNETSDTSHEEETIPGTDKKTHAGERHENKTSNDETNVITSKSGDEQNDEAAQKGINPNDKGNNERNDTSHVEKTKTEKGKITYEGESNENKTENDETIVLISEPTDDGNNEETRHSNNPNDKGYNETSDTSQAEKTIQGADKITHEGESDENKTDNDETNVLMCKPDNVKHDEASYNWAGETNNDENDIVTENVKADQIDANAKEMGETCGGDSNSNKEGNDSETPDEKMITDKDRQETPNKETNDEIIPEGAVYNEDANIPHDAPESPEAYEESYDKKKKGSFVGFLQNNNPFKRGTKNKKNVTHIPSSQPKQPSVTNSIEADVNSHDGKENKSSFPKKMFGIFQKPKSNKTKDTNILDRAPGACRSMADQTQTESLDQGATKDSSAEGNGGVNGMTNETINEENRTDVNDKIDKECQKRNSGADDKENNESSDTSHTEKTIPGTDKTTHEGESHEHKADNDQTKVMIGKPANEKYNEASYNREGETNNDEKGIVNENVNADQIDANAKEMGETCGGDSSSNKEGNDSETPDEKMITDMDRQETANKETNDETIPEGTFYNEDTNIPQDVPMAFPNERDNMSIQDENKQLKKKLQELINQTIEEKNSNAKALNETTALLRARDAELEKYRSVIQPNNADISQLTEQIQQLQLDKSDLLLRLSKVASAKLTQNNPNIADLSDANRPTKLAEQFSELYDNEYTDAIEEQQGIEEQAAIESMLTLLQAANEECVELARKQEHGKTCLTTFSFKVDQYPILRERSMLTDSGDNECSIVKTTIDQETDEVRIEIQLPDEHSKSLSDIRRLCATKVEEDCSMSKIIASKIALQRGITPESGPKTLAYITKCAKLCWYMVIKEPPVLVGFRAVVDGEPFNKDMYKSYTKAGELLDFVVWPPLYLHKDGPLLCKGVAQGK